MTLAADNSLPYDEYNLPGSKQDMADVDVNRFDQTILDLDQYESGCTV